MNKIIFLAASLVFSISLNAQTVLVPFSGNSTTTACSGTVQDHAGNSSYSNGANGYLVIDPPGTGTVSLTFTQFSTESCCDRVYLYDGVGTTATLIGNYGGGALPNGGNPITSTGGAITVRFYSDGSVTSSGFTASWVSAGGSLPPLATLSVSTTTPAFNTPVTFTNTSNFQTTTWLFGDGNTATTDVATHSYTASGTYQARLVVENCLGVKDTSNPINITVQAAPNGSLSVDTVHISVPCGSTNSTAFSISNSGAGSLNYNLVLEPTLSNQAFRATFENSTLNGFVNQAPIYYNTTIVSSGAPQGNQYLQFQGDGNYNDGLKAVFTPQAATTASYKTMQTASTYYSGYVEIGEFASGSFSPIFYSLYYYGALRLYYGNGFGGQYVYYGPNLASTWHDIELKNIDYTTQTYDIYLNGALVVSGASFINYASAINQIEVYSPYLGTTGLDDFFVGNETAISAITFNPNTGTLANGGNTAIFINANATGLNAGTYYLDFVISSNDLTLNGLRLPVELTVTGTANLVQSTSAVGFGSVFSNQTFADSVLIFNSGCDTLNFNSFTTSTTDLLVQTLPFDLAPNDSAFLHYTFSPTQVATYSDSIYLNGPDTNSFIQITAQVSGAPIASTNPTSLNITVNGCPDTVDFNLTLFNTGLSALNWGTNAALSGVNSDDFEASTINSSLWSSWSSGVTVGNSCGVISGSQSLIFNGTGTRYIETVPINASSGGNLEFDYWQSTCELADAGEGLYVFYSLNNGLTWTQMGYFYTSITTTTYNASLPIPTAAQVNGVVFKIQQSLNSGLNFDNWVIDNFSVSNSFSNTVIFTPDTGSVAINDSVQILGQIVASGLASGTYSFPVYINTNDPSNPLLNIPVSLTIIGQPIVSFPPTCVLADSTFELGTTLDSALVYNSGCADLIISNVTTSGTIFSAITTTKTIMPGDSAYLKFSFNPPSIGYFSDSLSITSNNTLAKICIGGYGIGAPHIDADSTLISVTLNSCSDSLTIPFTIKNVGASNLNYQFLGSGNSGDTIKILALTLGYQLSNYNNAINGLAANMQQPYTITPLYTTISTVLQNELQNGYDILWVPPLYTNYSTTYTAFAPVVQSYLNNGGKLIVGSGDWAVQNIWNLGIFTGNGITRDYGSQNLVTNSAFANHPVLDGVSSAFISSNATHYFNISNPGVRVLASRVSPANYNCVHEIDYAGSKALWIGFDWYSINADFNKMLANAFTEYGQSSIIPNWLTILPDSGMVAQSDSVVVNLTFKANGNGTGIYNDTLVLSSNDPQNPTIRIPVQLTINGNAELVTDQSCKNIGSTFVGLETRLATAIFNPGCDTLVIDSTFSNNNLFGLANLPLSIAPADSIMVDITFTPDTIGFVQDSLFLFSNANYNVGICVNGTGLGAPKATPQSDTLVVTINKCDGFTQVPFIFNNTGQGNLSYVLKEKSIYRQTSTQYYNTTYATTNHSFTNTPSTADTVFFMCVVNGDYNSDFGGEYYSFYAESSYQSIFDNNVPDGVNDTSYGYYVGPLINTWLANNQLDVSITNGYGVNVGVGQDMHFVEVRMETTPAWMTILSAKTGNLATGASTNKTVLFNANSLPVGVYNSTILIESNDPVNPTYPVYVTLKVVDKPTLEIPNNCINYGFVSGTTPRTDSVLIVNSGCQNLVVNNLQFANPVFSTTVATLTIPAKDSAYIPVTLTPTQAATLNSNMLVFTNDTTLSVCLTATISLAPNASIDHQIVDACEGEVDFTDVSTNSPNQWQWQFGDGQISYLQNPTHTYEKPGVYTVTLFATNAGGTDSTSLSIDMSKVLYVDFSKPDTIRAKSPAQFYDSSLVATSWQWFFGDGGTSTAQNPVHTYNLPGTYFLTFIASNADCSIQKNRQITVLSGIGLNENQIAEIVLFPTPTAKQITARWDNENTFSTLSILDITGKVLMRTDVSELSEITLDVANMADGIYLAKFVTTNGQVQVMRFTVKH